MKLYIKMAVIILSVIVCSFAQGNSLADTVYYQSDILSPKEKIYSITQYNSDKTVKRYTVIFINGTVNYYKEYDYVGKICNMERIFDSKNTLQFYGEFTDNPSGGKDYKYYTHDSILLYDIEYDSSLSAFDSTWQIKKYTARTADNKILNSKVNKYSTDGWLKTEFYFDNLGDTTGTGSWTYDPSLKTTIYTYNCKRGIQLYTRALLTPYDQYRYYYNDSTSTADSLKIFINDTLIHTTLFDYDSKGWLREERIHDKTNTLIYRGEYSFDKATSVTTYQFYKDSSSLQFETKSDYQGKIISTDYFPSDQKSYTLKYSYNDGHYWDTISKYDSSNSLVSYETYLYYIPYYVTKKYATFNEKGILTSFYNYDEYGKVIDSMPFGTPIQFGYKTIMEKSKIAMLKNNFMIINLSKSSYVQWTVFDQTGRQISHFKKQLPVGLHKIQVINEAQLAKKNYLISGNIGSIPISGKVCYLP